MEGAPDPFPSLSEPTNQAPRQREKQAPAALDTQSEDAFPSLAPASAAPAAQTQSAWGSGPRIKAPVVPKVPVFTDSFTLAAMDLSNAGRDGKAASLGEVIKTVMNKYKVKIEASGNQRTRQTTFHIKAESQKELDKAKRSLLALTSPVVSNLTPDIDWTTVYEFARRLSSSSMHLSRPSPVSLVPSVSRPRRQHFDMS